MSLSSMKTETSETKIKILIVEDQVHLRESIAEILEANEYYVHTAANGKQGLLMALDIVHEIIISDIMMPEMDGYQLLENIRKSKLGNIPFLFLTAKTDHQDYRHGMKLGADDYLFKPFKADELLEAVAVRIERRKKLLQEIEGKTRLLKQKQSSLQNHEVNTPLNGILGFSEMLLENLNELSGLVLRHVNIINKEVDRLTQLMNDVLTLGKIEANKISFSPSDNNLLELVNEVIEQLSYSQADNRSLKIITRGTERSVYIDASQMNHVISNLLSNALKYSAGKPEPEINIYWEKEGFSFVVRDYGIGIPDTDINNIFESFYRATNVSGISGTGLGLVLVKNFVNLHNGTIELKSELNKGTVVSIRIQDLALKNKHEENTHHRR